MQDYQVVERAPDVREYNKLRRAVGWSEADEEAALISIEHSLYWICIYQHNTIIGCGRVIGDGGLCFYIQDIIVIPAQQGRGLGHCMMTRIMQYVQAHARPGGFVGLMAAKGASSFYLKYGFVERPSEHYGPGMILFW